MATLARTQGLLIRSLALLAFAGGMATLPAAVAEAQDAPAPVQAAPLKIAVLDTGKVLTESEEGIRI